MRPGALTRTALLALAALPLSSCDPRKFDDLADTVWYKQIDNPGPAASGDYGSVVAGVDVAGAGAQLVILDSPFDTVHVVALGGGGGVDDDLAETAPFPITDGSRIHSAVDVGGGRLAVGFVDNIAVFDTPLQFGGGRALLTNPTSEIVRIGLRMVSADFDGDGTRDLVTGSENAYLAFFPNLDGATFSSCRIEDDMTAPVVLDAIAAGEGGEVIVAVTQNDPVAGVQHKIAVVDVDLIIAEQADNRICEIFLADDNPQPSIPFKATIAFAPESIATADLDGSAPLEIVAASGRPGNGVVVSRDGTTRVLGTAGQFDCNSAGMRVSVAAGNFDAEPTHEILVGNPCATAEDTADAGSVFVFEANGTLTSTLYDAEPQDNQRFGRSLAVVPFSGDNGDAPILVVGALDEAFVYFRLLAAGRDPRFAQ